MTYAQRGEDDLVAEIFGDYVGRYCDIGSYDGRTFSNIRALAERGWEGVCVEPAAHAFNLLASDPPPGSTLVNALVGNRSGLVSFNYSRDALSTTEDKHASKWSKITDYTPIYAVAVTLSELLAAFPGPYDLISVDTEGTSLAIIDNLRGYLRLLETRCLIYEHDGVKLDIEGFHEIHRTPENAILWRT